MTKGEFIWDGVIRQLPSWWFDMNTKKAPPSQPSSTVGENHDGDQTVGGIKGDLIWYQGQEYKGNTQNTMMKKTTPRNVVIVMAEDGRRVQPWERRLVFLVNISFVGTKKTSIMVNIFRAKCFKLSVNISYKMHQIVKRNTWYRAIDSRNEICSSGPDDQRWDCCWWRGCWSSSCWRWWWPVHGRRSRQWQGLVRCWWVACHRGNPTECRMADDGKMARVPKLPHMERNMQVKPDSDAWTSARSSPITFASKLTEEQGSAIILRLKA